MRTCMISQNVCNLAKKQENSSDINVDKIIFQVTLEYNIRRH